MQRVIDRMNREVLRVTPDETVAMAASLMQDKDACSTVVEEDGTLVGVLTDHDIAVQAIVISATTPIRNVMDDRVRCCREDEDADVVARRMAEAGILRLPVVDRRDHVVGFMTLRRATGAPGVPASP